MSQSDYLKYKKVGTILKVDNTATGNMLPPILDQSDYLSFVGYSLEGQINNTKNLYNELVCSGEQIIFDMQLQHINTCPSFVICQNTNTRPNRVPNLGYQRSCFGVIRQPQRTTTQYVKNPENPNSNTVVKCVYSKTASCSCSNPKCGGKPCITPNCINCKSYTCTNLCCKNDPKKALIRLRRWDTINT